MDPTPSLALSLLLATAAIAAAVAGAPPPQPTSCTSELVGISACLPLVAPLAAADSSAAASGKGAEAEAAPSAACCDAFLLGLGGGGAACLCHLVRDPLLLGFPINASRIASLFASCGAPNPNHSVASSFSEMCNESQSLPPLRSITWNDTSIPSPVSSEESANPFSVNRTRPDPLPICPCPKLSEPDLTLQPHLEASAQSLLLGATPLILTVLALFMIEEMTLATD